MKKLLLSSCLSLLLLSSVSAFAGNQLLKNGQTVNQENVKSGEQINAMTVLIRNYEEFKKEWEYTSFEHKPQALLADKAKVGDTVHLVTFFSHYLPDEDNKCNMSFKVRMFKDDILVLNSPKTDYKVNYIGDTALQLSNVVLGSTFEANEIGKYIYEVTVTDENADDTVLVKTRLTVTEK